MTSLQTLAHIASHARNWHLNDHLKALFITDVQAVLVLEDGAVELLIDWARTFDAKDRLVTGTAPGPLGHLEVSGRVLCGDLITVTVQTDGDALRAAGLVGVLVLGQVEQHAHHRTAVPA